ncbi:MAG: hypothetical protein R6U40_07480 [Desulfobacterales bacterium]
MDLVHEAHTSGRVHVIAINNAHQIAPWADVLYACDCTWWDWYYAETETFQGLRITRSKRAVDKYPDLTWIEGEAHDQGLSKRQDSIVNGRIGGYQAINLAVNFGAKKILLIGFDMRVVGGSSHWHGDHPNRQRPMFTKYAAHFRNMIPDLEERGVKIINCTPESAIDAFPFGNLKNELEY